MNNNNNNNLAQTSIAILAGHFNKDSGAVSGDSAEVEITAEVSFNLAWILGRVGAYTKVIGGSLKNRVERTKEFNPDLTVSVHANSFSSPNAHGIETLYNPESGYSRRLAQCLNDSLVTHLGLRNRGIKERTNLYVLNQIRVVPVALVEIGFISNPGDFQLMNDSYDHIVTAFAIMRGINEFLGGE